MSETDRPTSQTSEPARPGLLKQLIPFAFAVGILVWVFTGLSANVMDESHRLFEQAPSRLGHVDVIPESIVLRDPDGSRTYCLALSDAHPSPCPGGPDAVLTQLPDKPGVFLQRVLTGRIPEGGQVQVDYVYTLNPGELKAQLADVSLVAFLPAMLLLALVFFAADVFGFGYAYRRFNVPAMPWSELMLLRGGPYLVQVGLAPLAEILFPLYLLRVKRVPVTHTLSSNIWTLVNDLAAIATVVTPAVIYNVFVNPLVPAVGMTWLLGCLLFWLGFAGHIAYFHWLRRKAAGRKAIGILNTFAQARMGDYLRVYLARLVLWCVFLLANFVTLRAVGIDPGPALALIGIPLVVMSIFMPIGVGGYGGPQLIAWFIFVKVGQAGDAESVILYSLLFSTAFLIGRALIGLCTFWGFWRRLSASRPLPSSG